MALKIWMAATVIRLMSEIPGLGPELDVIARDHLALTAGLLLKPSPRDDCLLLRRRRESTEVSAAGSNIPAELGIFTCLKTAMRLTFVRSFITRDVHMLRFGLL